MGHLNRSRVIVVAILAVVLGGGLLYIVSPASLEIARPGEFSGMAIVILGYLLYPVLALLAVGLLVVALLMGVGASIERRREQSRK